MIDRDQRKSEASALSRAGHDSRKAWASYNKLRNQVNNRLKIEEKNFKLEKFMEIRGSPSDNWKTAKLFMNWENSAGPPSQLQIGGTLLSKAKEIASEMNRFFINKVNCLRSGIQFQPNMFENCYKIMEGKKCTLDLSHVSLKRVSQLLKGIKSSKSNAIDTLDSHSIKIAADVIARPIHHLVCLSIIQCKFPTAWKLSTVIPLHKKGSKLEQKNYRPVAILSPLSKILEKVVYQQLYTHFSKNNIFDNNLHGYRTNHSTQTALVTMFDRWVRASSIGQVSGVVMIDLSAAFDLVDHNLLLSKLQIYGVQKDFTSWVSSYLGNRQQAVWLDHALSEFIDCDVGVPQGSILGPLFFLIFFNDLPNLIKSSVDTYADDTTLTATGKTIDVIEQQLSKDCNKLSKWMKANRLKLNHDKTQVMTMGTRQRLTNTRPLNVQMDGVMLHKRLVIR